MIVRSIFRGLALSGAAFWTALAVEWPGYLTSAAALTAWITAHFVWRWLP